MRQSIFNMLGAISIAFFALLFSPSPALSLVPIPCVCVDPQACTTTDCNNAEQAIKDINKEGTDAFLVDNDHPETEDVGDDFNGQFNDFEEWLMRFSRQQIIPAMQRMTAQLSAVAMQQVFAIGTFFDAELQLGAQRLHQKLKVEAHRDYQPSEDFCWFGTNVRSMASTQERSRVHSMALNAHQMGRHLGNTDNATSLSPDDDKRARWNAFRANYCDPQDNNWQAASSGLQGVCLNGGADSARVNIDIDYTRLIDNPRTLDVGFVASENREDVFALAHNLYGHDVLKRDMSVRDITADKNYKALYLALRSVAARRNVAENSFNAIVKLKAAGTSDTEENEPQTREFLAAILKEMGVPDGEIYDYIGEQPSYYAQLEILAKTIYQNPDFYANLYDKPANVARKSVALKAIELMLDREIYESQLRREMATSVLLSTRLQNEIRDINEQNSGGEK